MTGLRRIFLSSFVALACCLCGPANAGDVVAGAPIAPETAAEVVVETTCTRADAAPGLPARMGFKIIDENQIEAWAWDRKDQPTPAVRLQAQELPSQPGLALFNVAGQLTVSGDAKLLITRTALKYRNVGRLLFTNRTSSELSTYHCN